MSLSFTSSTYLLVDELIRLAQCPLVFIHTLKIKISKLYKFTIYINILLIFEDIKSG